MLKTFLDDLATRIIKTIRCCGKKSKKNYRDWREKFKLKLKSGDFFDGVF